MHGMSKQADQRCSGKIIGIQEKRIPKMIDKCFELPSCDWCRFVKCKLIECLNVDSNIRKTPLAKSSMATGNLFISSK